MGERGKTFATRVRWFEFVPALFSLPTHFLISPAHDNKQRQSQGVRISVLRVERFNCCVKTDQPEVILPSPGSRFVPRFRRVYLPARSSGVSPDEHRAYGFAPAASSSAMTLVWPDMAA